MGLLEKNASVWHQAELTLLIIDILYVERYYIDEKQRGIARLEIKPFHRRIRLKVPEVDISTRLSVWLSFVKSHI